MGSGSSDDPGTPREPVVTAVHARDRERVAIELDGAPWRVVPLEAAHRAGIGVGSTLGRGQARALRAELRRQQALAAGVRALRRREHTITSLDARMERGGIAPAARRRALDTLSRAGLVDDARYASSRAAHLAERDSGDLLIADDLARHGVPVELVEQAIASLPPEAVRAREIVARRGLTTGTVRRLAARGFGDHSLEAIVAELEAGA